VLPIELLFRGLENTIIVFGGNMRIYDIVIPLFLITSPWYLVKIWKLCIPLLCSILKTQIMSIRSKYFSQQLF